MPVLLALVALVLALAPAGVANADPSDTGDAAGSQAKVISASGDQSLKAVVPYGVDVPVWLNQHAGFFLVDGQAAQPGEAATIGYGDQPDRLTGLVGGTAGPLALADRASSYPTTQDSQLVWATPSQQGVTTEGDVPSAAMVEIGSPTAAPAALLDRLGLDVVRDGVYVPLTYTTAASGDPMVWVRGDDAWISANVEKTGSFGMSSTGAVDAHGNLSGDAAQGWGFSAFDLSRLDWNNDAATLYVKLPADYDTNGDGSTDFYAGQVVTVALRRDGTAPTSEVALVEGGAELAGLDATYWVHDDTLVVGKDVLSLHVSAGDGADGSGVESVVLYTNVSPSMPQEVVPNDKGEATLSLGAGTYDLDECWVEVRDQTGNVATTTLSSLGVLGDLDSLRVLGDDAKPTIEDVRLVEARRGKDVSDGATRGGSDIRVRVTVRDPLLADGLAGDEDWLASRPLRVSDALDGGEAQTYPSESEGLAEPWESWESWGAYTYEVTIPKASLGSGVHTVEASYLGVTSLYGHLGDSAAYAATPVSKSLVVDADPPAAVSYRIEGFDASDVATTTDASGAAKSTYVSSTGDQVIVVNVEDKGRAGITSATATAKRATTMGGAASPVSVRVSRLGKGAYAITLPEGLYQLSDIRLTLEDRAGNVTPNGGVALDTVAYESGTSPASAILVHTGGASARFVVRESSQATSAMDAPEQSPVYSSGRGDFYPPNSLVVLQVTDPWFDLVSRTAAFRTLTPVTDRLYAASRTSFGTNGTSAARALVDADFLRQTSEPGAATPTYEPLRFTSVGNDTFELVYPFPAVGGKLADGKYQVGSGGVLPDSALTLYVDTKKPTVTGASFTADGWGTTSVRIDGDGTPAAGEEWRTRTEVVFGRHADVGVDLAVKDLLPDEPASGNGDYASGLKEVKATYRGGSLPVSVDGTRVVLSGEGIYDLSAIEVTATDNCGNSTTCTLGDFAPQLGFSQVAVSRGWNADVSIQVGGTSTEVEGRDYRSGGAVARVRVHDPLFSVMRRLDPATYGQAVNSIAPLLSATYTDEAGVNRVADESYVGVDGTLTVGGTTKTGDELRWGQESDGAWYYEVPFSRTNGNLADGRYDISFTYMGTRQSAAFYVDATAPQLTSVEVERDGSSDKVAKGGDGSILVGGEREVRVRIQDLLPGAKASDVPGRDQDGASGVVAEGGWEYDTVKAEVSYATSAHATEKTTMTLDLAPDDQGYATLDLSAEGLYDLADVRIVGYDHLGNRLERTLADYASSLPEDEAWDFSSILVYDSNSPNASHPQVDVSISDVEGVPASKDPYYHRGDATVTMTVSDPWFEVARMLGAGDQPLTGTVRKAGSDADSEAGGLALTDFARHDGTDTWTATYTLPRANGSDKLPVEGDYTLHLLYRGLGGYTGGEAARDEDWVDQGHGTGTSFGVDYTPPTFGRLELSQVAPFPTYTWGEHRGEPWGIIFSKDAPEVGTLPVSDNLAGVSADSLAFSTDGQEGLERSFADGVVSFTFDGDGRRLSLDDTSILVEDAAGNRAETGALSAYGDSNIPSGAHTVVVDSVAPQVFVTYDNNDVRNGKYYNQGRVATVTVDESNFDLLRQYEPGMAIAAAYRDESGSPSAQLSAQDFSPQTSTADDGTTRTLWVATLEAKEDADWRVSASLTDSVGHASNVVEDSFVVDTTAPVLMVTFDNEDMRNGMYFNAPRTATIQVMDRNFAAELGKIDARALADGPAPGVSGWTETEPRAEWVATASFTGETHYQLGVTASDLAGNVAEPYDSGEFVIDMTAPQVKIEGVTDHTAYGDEVAPRTSYSDINLDTLMSNYTIKGVRNEDTYFAVAQESETQTDKAVVLSNVPYEVEYDDVYTMSSQAVDLAGNTADAQVVFSVNRFGSTYYFAPGSEGVQGAFLGKAQDVGVVEINVSGLKTDMLRADLSQDDSSRELVPDEDYTIDPNRDDRGWSATTYTFPAALFEDDGYYRVALTSTDTAGRLSQNGMAGKGDGHQGEFPVSFAVDTTRPTAQLVGVEANGVYLDPSKTVIVDAGDNLAVDRVRVYQDDTQVGEWSGDDLSGGTPATLRLASDGVPHTYSIDAVDRAGNVVSVTCPHVVATGSIVTYVLNTPELLQLCVGVLVAALAVVAVVVYLVVRRHRMTERLRNPFGH